MRAVFIVVLAVALSSCANSKTAAPRPVGAPPATGTAPGQPPGNTVSVEIVVNSNKAELDAQCKKVGVDPTTIFVVTAKDVFHCVGSVLHGHAEQAKGSLDMAKSVVRAQSNDRVRWWSKTHTLRVVSVVKDPKMPPQAKEAPDFPFGKAPFPAKPANEAVSPPVPTLRGDVEQRYKASFDITGVGLVDPDIICMM
jgi:hypothetical protein